MLRLLRRLHAILLLLSFALSMAVPALASAQGDSGLPACCRKGGKHHCAMAGMMASAMADAASAEPSWKAPLERCPYCPSTPAGAHAPQQTLGLAEAAFVLPAALHPAGVTQTECKWRMARERSRQKRGPPQFLL